MKAATPSRILSGLPCLGWEYNFIFGCDVAMGYYKMAGALKRQWLCIRFSVGCACDGGADFWRCSKKEIA